jgi:monoamine oxidase
LLISRFTAVQPFVKLNTPISAIDYSADPIVLTAKDGSTFQADKVIVTVPVSIIKNGNLSFSPGLPGSFTGSLAKIGMGASLRAIIEFKRNFWGDSAGYILGSSNFPEFLSVGLNRSVFNATLSVTVNGSKAATYSSLGDGVIASILADLDVLYPGQPGQPGLASHYVRKKVVDGLETDPIFIREDWTTNEFILGGHSYPLAGATNDDRKAIGQPISSKLFFAGEATDVSGQAGMVNGALASAERCAEEVVTSILNPV